MASIIQIAHNSRASQGKLELLYLLNELSKINPKVILEIGVHQGYSLQAWREAFDPELLIGIDNDITGIKYGPQEGNYKLFMFDSHDPRTLKMVKKALDGRKVDFLFIDGDHSYKGVKQDYEMYSPLVKRGGVVCFHDVSIRNHPDVKVNEVFRELISSNNLQFVEYQKDANGIGLIYV